MTDRSIPMDENEALAGEYALGTLTDAARAAFERRLAAEPALARAVAAWEARFAGGAAVAPPSSVWAGIARQIGLAPAAPSAAAPVTVREAEGQWRAISPGVAIKVLHVDAAARRRSILVRVDPGADYVAHDHEADEECMMLSGSVAFADGLTLRAGDYHLMPAGRPHAPSRSPEGALFFVRQYYASTRGADALR
jgi:anti-sigma-K factor RskA